MASPASATAYLVFMAGDTELVLERFRKGSLKFGHIQQVPVKAAARRQETILAL